MNVGVGERYKHYKGGEYTIIAIGRLESDPHVECVVYRAEYATHDMPKGTVWIRPRAQFEETILVEDVPTCRFSKI